MLKTALFGACLLCFGILFSQARVLEVDTHANAEQQVNGVYADFALALRAAVDGDTILMNPLFTLYQKPAVGELETTQNICNATNPLTGLATQDILYIGWYPVSHEIRVTKKVAIKPKCILSFPVGFELTSPSSCRMFTIQANDVRMEKLYTRSLSCGDTSAQIGLQGHGANFIHNNFSAPYAVFSSLNLGSTADLDGLLFQDNLIGSRHGPAVALFNTSGTVTWSENAYLGSPMIQYYHTGPLVFDHDNSTAVDMDLGMQFSQWTAQCQWSCPTCAVCPTCKTETVGSKAGSAMVIIILVIILVLIAIVSIVSIILHRRNHTVTKVDEDGIATEQNVTADIPKSAEESEGYASLSARGFMRQRTGKSPVKY